MKDTEDASHIKLPTAVFIALLGSVASGSAGVYGLVGPSQYHDKLSAIEKDITDIRETAKAALAITMENSRAANDTRQLIFDRTADRYDRGDAAQDWREQEERNQQQERRLMQLERQLDKLSK